MPVRDNLLPAVVVVLALGLGGPSVMAQEGASAGRAWTDPPARTVPAPMAAGNGATVEGNAVPPKERASSSVARTRASSATARRSTQKTGATKVAARRVTPVERQAARSVDTRSSTARMARGQAWTVRAYQPYHSEGPALRYGYMAEQPPAYRSDTRFPDYRAARIRQAREAGYLVVRGSDLPALRERRFNPIGGSIDSDDAED